MKSKLYINELENAIQKCPYNGSIITPSGMKTYKIDNKTIDNIQYLTDDQNRKLRKQRKISFTSKNRSQKIAFAPIMFRSKSL